ncbi:hypothetical protein VTL71DRAFT_12952 [Oculimacula yallundae]|uniref:Uncharacterized protein n=1 Tax=Oculimacula yallundae TaxID=86028 RepID=A0ABR4CQ87_9HELO
MGTFEAFIGKSTGLASRPQSALTQSLVRHGRETHLYNVFQPPGTGEGGFLYGACMDQASTDKMLGTVSGFGDRFGQCSKSDKGGHHFAATGVKDRLSGF